MGEGLARLLGLEVEDELVLLSAHPQAGLGAGRVRVVGIFRSPEEELGRTLVQVHIETAQRLIRRPGAITSVVGFVTGVAGPWDAWKIDGAVQG